MDDRRFDALVRMVGAGASRRSILKGLLGLGGAAVIGDSVAESLDARALNTRPTVPPPTTRPPAPPPTTTTTPCPAGQQQCPNSTVCCDPGTCARSGNRAICCSGTVCGLECCEHDYQCCDRECCGPDAACPAQIYGEGPFVDEESCCPVAQTCRDMATGHGKCCDGGCFTPTDSPATGFDRVCCEASEGATVCVGTGEFAGNGACCAAGTRCCNDSAGRPVCISEDQCCSDSECPDDPAQCLAGVCDRDPDSAGNAPFTCDSVDVCSEREPGLICCPGGNNHCYDPAFQCCTIDDCIRVYGHNEACVECRDDLCQPFDFNEDPCGDEVCEWCMNGRCLPVPVGENPGGVCGEECGYCDGHGVCANDPSLCEFDGCLCMSGSCVCPSCRGAGAACDLNASQCCEWLGCFRQSEGAAICADCLEEDERCSDDSNCCTGLVCDWGECSVPRCLEDSDCGPCGECTENFYCIDGKAGESCGPCLVCRSDETEWGQTIYGCLPVENESTDPLCPEETICCGGACHSGETCACSAEDQCDACFRCDDGLGACVFDCRFRDETGPCCFGCQSCLEAGPNWVCGDNPALCPGGGCQGCFNGVCGDDDDRCLDCERCVENQCVFDCNTRGADGCCNDGTCGKSLCRPDGTCLVAEDPNEFCGACRQCVEDVDGSFDCRNVPDGSPDPTGHCPTGAGFCCNGVCTSIESCGCETNEDCGPCLACFRGTCISDCNRSGPDGPCCRGCQACDTESGICEDEGYLCGECGDCDGGVCRDDHTDCDDCELCFSGTCVFSCNNEEGPSDCCEDTGTCGVADACLNDTQCQYRGDEALCTGSCERCVGPDVAGRFNCEPDPECECANNADCGPCATCEAGECVAVEDGWPEDYRLDGFCCGGVFILYGRCCDENGEFCGDEDAICTPANQCIFCEEDGDCRTQDDDQCQSWYCDDGYCNYDYLPSGTLVPGTPGGICCDREDFEPRLVEGGNCCSDSDCGDGQSCCAYHCQDASAACECGADGDCGSCEYCDTTLSPAVCAVREDGSPRDGFFGICCDGRFIYDGDCCTDTHCCVDGTLENGQCCFDDYCAPTICRIHDCAQCGSDADCAIGDFPCLNVFCDAQGYCDNIVKPDGPAQDGSGNQGFCCGGYFDTDYACCRDRDCGGSTPFCAWDEVANRLICAACRWDTDCVDDDPCTAGRCAGDKTCSFEPVPDGFNPEGAGYCCGGVLQSSACSTTTTTPAPVDECVEAGGTRLANGTCLLRCTEAGECSDLWCGGSCVSMSTGMACMPPGNIVGGNCPNGTDDECPAGYACLFSVCLEVCSLAPPLITTTTPVPCDDPKLVRCESDGECHDCCGEDTSNCPSIGEGDAECYVCNANLRCEQIPRGAVCTIDGGSESGFCNGVYCEACFENDSNCSENFTCCSGFCDLAHPISARCADLPATITTPAPQPCTTTDDCSAGELCCASECVDTETAHNNCGACGVTCNNCQVCLSSGCRDGCENECTYCDSVDGGVCLPAPNDRECGESREGVCCDGACNESGTCSAAAPSSVETQFDACIPLTCADRGCGTHDDGCGAMLDCGACCTPRDDCNAGECGEIPDGCGGAIVCNDCPTTPAPTTTCLTESHICVNDDQCCDGLRCRSRTCSDRGRRSCRSDCPA